MRDDFEVFYHYNTVKPVLTMNSLRETWSLVKNSSKEHFRKNKLPIGDLRGPILVIYYYKESAMDRANLEFFFRHHNPSWADVFLLTNGGCSANIPDYVMTHNFNNIPQSSACMSLKVWPWVLHGKDVSNEGFVKSVRWKKYEYFVLLTSKVRGPFFPTHWGKRRKMDRNWLDVFKEFLSDEIGMVGASLNCMHGLRYLKHLQGMSMMTYRSGLQLMYNDLEMKSRILNLSDRDICSNETDTRADNILIYEIGASQSFISRGIGVHALQTAWQSVDILDHDNLAKVCFGLVDTLYPNAYFGTNVHPTEMIFYKMPTSSFKRVDVELIDLFTVWFDQRVSEYQWEVTYLDRSKSKKKWRSHVK